VFLATREDIEAAASSAATRTPPVLHVCRERDVGLFSLIQQVIANIPWALGEGRVPVADFRERISYWTPAGFQGSDSVWEYYFEPIIPGFPASVVPAHVQEAMERRFPDQNEPGYAVDEHTFVSNHYGEHASLRGKVPAIPYTTGNPDDELRRQTSEIIETFVRPREHVEAKANRFLDEHMRGRDVIGVHVRGTDAVSASEQREYRQGSLSLPRFAAELKRLLDECPEAAILVATDAESSLRFLADAFGERVIAYDAVRHVEGEAAGQGPTGCIMPAYLTADRDQAAQNGEDAVVEYLLLSRCSHLVHNGASLATTVLLKNPSMPHTNTHIRG